MESETLLLLLAAMHARMEQEKDYLTRLDNDIADGDHGINMARGFAAVEAKLPALAGRDAGTVLKTVGMTLVSAVGGSAGPLYGTAFMYAGKAVADKAAITLADFLACMDAAVEGVQMRGKAVLGEKTMLDAMIPARDAMHRAAEAGANTEAVLAAGIESARTGFEHTKDIIATKGRASYIGERSLGHPDPGAASFLYLLESIAAFV